MAKLFKSIGMFSVIWLSVQSTAIEVHAGEDWITEEVLKQLTEIRRELKTLRGEVQSLKDLVDRKGIAQAGNVGPKIEPVSLDQFSMLGDDNAQVVIIEFSDYQCPYCQRHFKQSIPLLTKQYIDPGQLQYGVSDFPLDFHPQARPAAKAVRCAGAQSEEAHWAMHNKLFSGEYALSKENYSLMASDLALDSDEFSSCLADPKLDSAIDDALLFAQSVGVRGTPAFLIGKIEGGKMVDSVFISGAQPFSAFSRIIDGLVVN